MIPYYLDIIGKPFKYTGRGPDSFDCYGVAVELYRRAGIKLPDYDSSEDEFKQASGFSDGASKYFELVDKPESMDIILFQILPKYITHCAVYLERGNFIHITHKTCVVVENLNHVLWRQRLRGFYRWRG